MTRVNKIDSNVTALNYIEEASLNTLPAAASQIWHPLEPNSYKDFGGQITTVARNPINSGRQRKKGVVTDIEASGGFNSDITQTNLQDILQGFFFADLRRKIEEVPTGTVLTNQKLATLAINAAGTGYVIGDKITLTGGTHTVSGVVKVLTVGGGGEVLTFSIYNAGIYSATTATFTQASTTGIGTGATFQTATYSAQHVYTVTSSDLSIGSLIYVTNFANSGNNGFKRVTNVTAALVAVASTLVAETANADLVEVGFQFETADATLDADGASLPAIETTIKNMTDFGIVPGEFVFIGGDAGATQFSDSVDNGFARVRSVSANAMLFDKTAGTMVDNNGASKTIQIFFGRVLKNEIGTAIVRRSYTLERKLGYNNDADITREQAEYLHGAIPGEFALNVPTADKVTTDVTFVAMNNDTIDENVDGANTLLTKITDVTVESLVEADAFNTSSDVSRIKLAVHTEGSPNPTPLFSFVQELTLTINNNLTPDKAVGVTGAFDVTAGTFEVGGKITAYFADVASVQAVRNNADITLDAHFVKANAGISYDVPLITLGDGRPNVEQDKAITLPLDTLAASGAKIHSTLNHTLLMVFWDYLPSAADV